MNKIWITLNISSTATIDAFGNINYFVPHLYWEFNSQDGAILKNGECVGNGAISLTHPAPKVSMHRQSSFNLSSSHEGQQVK